MTNEEDFNVERWDAGWEAAAREHKSGHPCSQNYIGHGGAAVDFRNGMTAYRDQRGLSDEFFDSEFGTTRGSDGTNMRSL